MLNVIKTKNYVSTSKTLQPYRITVKRNTMMNTYSYKETRCVIHVFAETKKEAVEYLIRKGFKATMKNVNFLPE